MYDTLDGPLDNASGSTDLYTVMNIDTETSKMSSLTRELPEEFVMILQFVWTKT